MTHRHSIEERAKELLRDGWERRFTADEPRLSEMREFYESLGLDVLIEQAMPEEGQECRDCFDADGRDNHVKTLFTREKLGTGPKQG
ncbi:MAG: hypothetical protein QG577_218 [Thermodesulfobacteriota bacterium]|nr:hypothetical protein [Thermodesulfobacteriota bacterium]